MRSDMIKKGDHQAPARSLLHATGALEKPTDMNKPFVAICNSYIDIVPGHVHLRELADIAKEAIREAGAIPFEFDTIGVDAGSNALARGQNKRIKIHTTIKAGATIAVFDAKRNHSEGVM